MTTCPKCQRLQCDEVWVADSPTTQHFDRFECKDCGPIPVTVHLDGKRPTEQSTTEDRDSLKAKLAQVEADAAAMREALQHDVPGSCWATGPVTGNPIEDLVVCPGCRALAPGAGQRLLDELAQLRAAADSAESKSDDDWLNAIGKAWMSMSGKPWETLDGEERLEGIDANVGRLFQVIEELRARVKELEAKP